MNNSNEMPIFVTQPSLPPLDEYVELLRDIWDRKWLTNKGHYHDLFEQQLAEYLGVKYVSLFCNGMIALQVGLQALKITGEVITTPYSFPATTHALWWNHCTPVFGDIDPVTCNLDPDRIESLISPKTKAILPVHVYGTPCDVEAIQRIADTYGLKVFYDAAHAFGVRIKKGGEVAPLASLKTQRTLSESGLSATGQRDVHITKHEEPSTKHQMQSILNFGDLSMLSFHATKVFNTAEGGALVTNDSKLKERIDFLKNFGFADEVTVVAPGTNGKMNELQAALGIAQLKYADEQISKRLTIDRIYREQLQDVDGIRILECQDGVTRNGSYFPIFVDETRYGMSRDALYAKLKANDIYPRRYFHPLISDFQMYRHLPGAQAANLPVARSVSDQVLCMPLFADLSEVDVLKASALIRER